MHMLFQPYVTNSAETSHVCTLHFIAPTYKTMMHVHCLHWLMSTGLLFQSAFYQP